jgi:hypothetical protein
VQIFTGSIHGLAHHWQRLLDEGRFSSMTEIAAAEGMNGTQVRRVPRLTLLAPELVERLVSAYHIVLEQVMCRTWSTSWSDQILILTRPE